MSRYLLRENAPLLARNTFGVACQAELLIDVRAADGLNEVLSMPFVQSAPVLVLGEGSNLLLCADVGGVVLSLQGAGIEVLEEDESRVRVRAQAGERWDDLVRWSVARDLFGLENLALIPGSVGAAPIQNIGAYGAEVASSIAWVEAYDRNNGTLKRLPVDECEFSYRNSLFKRESERWLICAVVFDLPRQGELRLDYSGVREELQAMDVSRPRPLHLAEAISRIRARKLPHPSLLGNAGSFFKNPEVDVACADALHNEFEQLPMYPASAQTRKLSAAWMIEHCGWRGYRCGDAGVAQQHALVLVNYGQASGADILDLARRVAESVQQRFGVRLEPEPRLIGARW